MIAIHPPMGWNSWDCYGAAVTEDTVRKNAEYMAAHLKDYGWEYIVVDIQWYQPTAHPMTTRPFADLVVMDGYRLMPAERRISPAGRREVQAPGGNVHSLGLKFGIHIMRGMPRVAAHAACPSWAATPPAPRPPIPTPSAPGTRTCTACAVICPLRPGPIMTASSSCMLPGCGGLREGGRHCPGYPHCTRKLRSFLPPAAPVGGIWS